ncbi:nicotinate phosphoribosyltransferase [Gonapodya prolifera JEL478]|uniref:Nicotinate phosphoribosyltransferase n=1 Tax=Gonapodya prolifera (strain JEL478) TaxID=1344416 RepID=A0A139AG74_GONPJ|nr:nicotinate phosphoribosyltransferase [Gonapodya prolifera JEL478]|eukprot:KXS15564.1 nicotinate phosphoribosyltransferase [Gonapodya prolifera JEL478]
MSEREQEANGRASVPIAGNHASRDGDGDGNQAYPGNSPAAAVVSPKASFISAAYEPPIRPYDLDAKDKSGPSGLQSILDNDLYKFTMQQAVLEHYPTIVVEYRFKTRSPDRDKFSQEAFKAFKRKVEDMKDVFLTPEEKDWIEKEHSYFRPEYLDYLAKFRFRPHEQVELSYDPATGLIDMVIKGLWIETILYAVPLLHLLSETFFEFMDTDWSYEGQAEAIHAKIRRLVDNDVYFSDFGTRRRRSYRAHEILVREMARIHRSELVKFNRHFSHLSGTSNVHLAMIYGLRPVGTVAHEWTMAISALEKEYGLEHANRAALEKWLETYPQPEFSIALSDTFGTEPFFRDFGMDLATRYRGVRHDSGSAIRFIERVIEHYRSLGIDPSTKTIIFSDALNIDRCIQYKEYCDKYGVDPRFGIGTHLTNDYRALSDPETKSRPLNIVIKLYCVDGTNVIKLSDEPNKYMGDVTAVQRAKEVFGIE